MEEGEVRSLTETPTWAVATVFSLMVASVVFFTKSVEFFAHWLDKRKRKPLLAALNKIKEALRLLLIILNTKILLTIMQGTNIVLRVMSPLLHMKALSSFIVCCLSLVSIAGEHGKMKQNPWLHKPRKIIIIIGTKLHRIVVKIAVEILDSQSHVETQDFKLRDELFWFGKPRLLLRIISQVWCSFITFPLYVIIAQMGSRFKKTVLSEGVRRSLHGWKKRVKARQHSNSNHARILSPAASMPLIHNLERHGSRSNRSNSIGTTSSITSSGRRLSLGNEGSRRRFSMVEYGSVGVFFTPRQSVDMDEERNTIGYGSDTSSDDCYEEEDDR
ncbi:MLO-like protein 4 [Bienertia sinuspersici]